MFRYIYCDMDQVLVNFLAGARRTLGVEFNDPIWQTQAEKWERLSQYPNFWYNLPWMPNAQTLWTRIRSRNPYVLTAYPELSPTASLEKKFWCQHQLLLPDHYCITVPCREDKQQYAVTNAEPNLLIDDHPKNVEEWIKAGGIGIIHRTVPETLDSLSRYL